MEGQRGIDGTVQGAPRPDQRCPGHVGTPTQITDAPLVNFTTSSVPTISNFAIFAVTSVIPPARISNTLLPSTWDAFDHLEDPREILNVFERDIFLIAPTINYMSNLVSFAWDLREGVQYEYSILPAIFQALAHSCPMLEEVRVSIHEDLGFNSDSHPISLPDIAGELEIQKSLRSVSRLIISYDNFNRAASIPVLRYIFELALERCPSLVDLKIAIDGLAFHDSSIIKRANWIYLRRIMLGLGGMEFGNSTHTADLSNLFVRHPHLENRLIRIPLFPITFSPNAFPNITSLSFVTWYPFSFIIPEDLANRLTCIIVPSADSLAGFFRTLPYLPALRGLVGHLDDTELSNIVQAAPMLERLGTRSLRRRHISPRKRHSNIPSRDFPANFKAYLFHKDYTPRWFLLRRESLSNIFV
ncbi:hypothetical protein M422DRAFT_247720 [Sphaerobolus stellatus SS14]|nr:hypothetical protein M422DRAFT_247720 [Sphaerobolus stellatus SS14]